MGVPDRVVTVRHLDVTRWKHDSHTLGRVLWGWGVWKEAQTWHILYVHTQKSCTVPLNLLFSNDFWQYFLLLVLSLEQHNRQ